MPALNKTSSNDALKQIKRMWRVLCCGCGFCGGEARREARLVKKVKRSMGPATKLEEAMAEAGDLQAQVSLSMTPLSLTQVLFQLLCKARFKRLG